MFGSNCLIPSSHEAWTPGRTRAYPVLHFEALPLSGGPQSDLVCASHPKGSHGRLQGWGSVGSFNPWGPLSSPQAPHLAPGQDLDSRLHPAAAPPLYQGPTLWKTRVSGSQTMPAALILLHCRPGLTMEMGSLRSPLIGVHGPLVPPQGPHLNSFKA